MKPFYLTSREARVLAALAVFGLVVPNGVFLWYFVTSPGLLRAALVNPISLVFLFEAFFLMFLIAWLIRRAGGQRPSGLGFIVMSLAGSLAFSVPAVLCLALRPPADPRAE